MNAVFSILLLAAILGFTVFLLAKQDKGRRSQYGPSGLSEFRTDLPLDDCFDRLDQHSPDDLFAYECRRENDGGFTLHLTLHQPTQQPLDTLYTLRLDPGRQTVNLTLRSPVSKYSGISNVEAEFNHTTEPSSKTIRYSPPLGTTNLCIRLPRLAKLS